MIKEVDAKHTDEVSIKQTKVPLVFISHASKDKMIIKLFVDNVLKKGLGLRDESIVFTSYEATGVVPGDNIPEYIKKNIRGADVVLAMISRNYKSSEVCMNEVGAAWALGKTPIQIMLPKTNFDKLGWLIHLDKAARIDNRDALDSLEEVICNRIGIQIPTAKHWNPCTRDFIDALKNLPDLCDEDEPEYSVVGVESGTAEIVCAPQYNKVCYLEKTEKEFAKIETSSNTPTSLVSKNYTSQIIASWKETVECVTHVEARFIQRKINRSVVKIELALKNNSNTAIENGTIILMPDNELVGVSKTNVVDSGSIIELQNVFQNVNSGVVTEQFNKPINPSATEELYDFYISAPHDIGHFQLLWKLETLKGPSSGSIKIKWRPEYVESKVEVRAGDNRIGTAIIEDYIVEE